MKILFLLRALTTGGAERRAALIARGLQQAGHEVTLAVFYGGGAMESELTGSGVRLVSLGKHGRWDWAGFIGRLIRLIHQQRPDIIYSFLSGPNLLTALLSPLFPHTRPVWALCASNMELNHYGSRIQWADRLETLLCRIPRAIIANSRAGRDHAVSKGYPSDRIRVVHNGFDTHRFCPNREAGRSLRTEWAIPHTAPLYGLIGRLDPMKGHAVFLKAAVLCLKQIPDAHFICVGTGPHAYRETLQTLARELGLSERLIWCDNHPDMPAVYNALDVLVSASIYGEGCSNVLGEAMASGTPCVVTDVGDSAYVVGEQGIVVPPREIPALSTAMIGLWQAMTDGTVKRDRIRQRIERHFSVAAMIEGTAAVFQSLAD